MGGWAWFGLVGIGLSWAGVGCVRLGVSFECSYPMEFSCGGYRHCVRGVTLRMACPRAERKPNPTKRVIDSPREVPGVPGGGEGGGGGITALPALMTASPLEGEWMRW